MIQCALLQKVCSQSLSQYVISLFKCALIHYACCKLSFTSSYLSFLFIINMPATAKRLRSKYRTMRCPLLYCIMFKCAPMHCACSNHLLQILIFLFIINKCAPLQNVCVQSLVECVVGLFIVLKYAPMHCACSKHFLQFIIFLFIINKGAPLQKVCGQSLVQCVIGFFIMFKCAPMHCAFSNHLL